jgi:hypothetical protein
MIGKKKLSMFLHMRAERSNKNNEESMFAVNTRR